LQGISSDTFPAAFQTLASRAHEFGGAAQIPISAADVGVAEVCRQYRQQAIGLFALAIPPQQSLDGKSVAQIVQTGTATSVRPSEADLTRDSQEYPIDLSYMYRSAAAGDKEVRRLGRRGQLGEEAVTVPHEGSQHFDCGRV
jgi:hypothetical protein